MRIMDEEDGAAMGGAHGQRIALSPLLQEPIVKFLIVVGLSSITITSLPQNDGHHEPETLPAPVSQPCRATLFSKGSGVLASP